MEPARRTRRGWTRSLFTALVGGSVAAGLAPLKRVRAQGAAGAAPLTLKLGHPDTAQHPSQTVALRYASIVERNSRGRINIEVFPGGQLGSEKNLVEGLQTGIVDMAMHTAGFLESFFPHIQVMDLPFLFKDAAAAERVLDGEIGRGLLADMPAKGIVGLAWGHYGFREVETRDRRVVGPRDLRGLKIRIQPGAVFAAMFKAVGAVPQVIDIGEVYIALSQNTVGGLELPLIAVVSSKIYEVTKYVALTNHVYNAGALMASKVRYAALPPDLQKVLQDAAIEISPYWRKLVADRTADARRTLEARGMTITTTDYAAFRQAMAPVYAEFRPRIGSGLLDKVLSATKP
jgi:tripartite ATP-independent transporter DctP family solute receptor